MAKEKQEMVEIEDQEPQPQPQPEPQRRQQPQPQPQGKICYGDCFACSFQQAVFCASTHARVAMRMVEQINRQYDEITEALGILTEEIVDFKKQLTIPDELINPLKGQA